MSAHCTGPRCERPPVAGGLCASHYAQQSRGRPLRPLRGPHGASPEECAQVTLRVPEADAHALATEADRRGLPVAEEYRRAVAAHAARLRRRA